MHVGLGAVVFPWKGSGPLWGTCDLHCWPEVRDCSCSGDAVTTVGSGGEKSRCSCGNFFIKFFWVLNLCRWQDTMMLSKKNPKTNTPNPKQLESENVFILQKRKCIENVNSWAFQIKWWNIPLYHLDSFDHAVDVLIPLKCIVKFLLKVLLIWLMFFLWGTSLKSWNKSFTFCSEAYITILFSQICFVA